MSRISHQERERIKRVAAKMIVEPSAGKAHSTAPSGSANTPLKAEVKDGILTVQIGIETLEWASRPENGGPLEGCKVDGRCRQMWAKDVVRAMEHENEIGESPLGKFLDSMMEEAANKGSAALCWPNARTERPEAYGQ